jgi:probable rRNA maturation factor
MSAANACAIMADRPVLIIDVADERWNSLSGLEDLCLAATSAVLTRALPQIDSARFEIGLTFINDPAVQALNREYRGKDKPTNILSFQLITDFDALPDAAPILLGDLVLAYETITAEASHQELSFAHHCTHLIVHGMLHLLGYDHIDDAEGDAMERLEVEILAGLGIGNPYIGLTSIV